jgi:hypothetical protein
VVLDMTGLCSSPLPVVVGALVPLVVMQVHQRQIVVVEMGEQV